MSKSRVNRLKIYLVLTFLLFIELTAFNKLRLYGARPELLLTAVIFFGLAFGTKRGMETGAVAGILKGLFSISPFGINVFSFLTAGLLSGFLRKKLFRHNFVTQFMLSNLSVYLLAGIVFFISDRMFLNDKAEFWKLAFYKGLYTGALAPFVFFILSGIFGNRNLNLDEN